MQITYHRENSKSENTTDLRDLYSLSIIYYLFRQIYD